MSQTARKYLEPGDPGAFDDWEPMQPTYGLSKKCHVCDGYGGWNLTPYAYAMPAGYSNTPRNRHLYVHFRTMCSHCWGHGYVHESELCIGHEWERIARLGNCLNLHKCKHCGKQIEIDSSD